jgi:hypothetical protein
MARLRKIVNTQYVTNLHRGVLIAAILFSNASFAIGFKKWPVIPDPPRSNVAWVAENMRQNGVPMKIRNFSSKLDSRAIVEFYRATWTNKRDPQPVVNKVGEWTVIGIVKDDFVLTVQTKNAKKGSEGFLAVSTLPAAAASGAIEVDKEFPRLPGTQIMSDTRSVDSLKVGKTLIMKNNHSVRSNTTFYMNRMKSRGWTIDPIAKEASSNATQIAYLFFKRGKVGCTITVTPMDKEIGSAIVVSITNTSV